MKSVWLPAALLAAGCAALADRATYQLSDDLEAAILDYDDPGTVASGLPAYLLLLEARLKSRPEDTGLRLSTARLTSAYASLFVDDPQARRRLHHRALEHARAGACLRTPALCGLTDRPFEEFVDRLDRLDPRWLETVYTLGTTWAGWIESHREDFGALADLPKVEAMLEWVGDVDPVHDDGAVWLYLGVLNSQRPPAAGGQPDLARTYFERAREISRGENLLINVFMADTYARLMFDRELFVELLEEVLAAEPVVPGFVLGNRIAQQRARELLDKTEKIFN